MTREAVYTESHARGDLHGMTRAFTRNRTPVYTESHARRDSVDLVDLVLTAKSTRSDLIDIGPNAVC